jgi:hypothetical protein
MKKIILCCWFLACFSFASSFDVFFNGGGNPLCGKIIERDSLFRNEEGQTCFVSSVTAFQLLFQRARVRIIDPPEISANPGFRIERPFLIVDGIHLDPEIPRTLNDFEKDVEAYGLPTLLKSLGYTPILVQFPNTVETSLEANGKTFSNILNYLTKSNVIPWASPKQDGFVVLGISQGGVLGRYGSYLYDISRKDSEAPIRFFASLDSPHQGAVMPRGVLSTINFWALQGVPSAEDFADLVSGPGARELLLYDTQMGASSLFKENLSKERWLFKEYRKAAEYKGFPSVLLSEGQIRGKENGVENLYFELNRYAEKFGMVWGRAISRVSYSKTDDGEFSYNRVYEKPNDKKETRVGKTIFDKVQGSVYPFGETMYNALRGGMLEEIPNNMKYKLPLIGKIDIDTKWDDDVLKENASTFIPTTSALDLKCNGKLSVETDCLHKQTESGINWENPGDKSSAKSIYAVDATHPRANEKMSGRHIEFPEGRKNVLAGIQTDLWRLFCQLAKADFDTSKQEFRNSAFMGFFNPKASCMDGSLMPPVIKNAGVQKKEKFSWVRYDFAPSATEKDNIVKFALPAGWQKSVRLDYGKGFPANSIVEVQVKMENPKGNWMRAEFLLTRQKNGGSQIQLEELPVKPDGSYYTLRWRIPGTDAVLKNYRWGRLVLNSSGGEVSVANLRIIRETLVDEFSPILIPEAKIYPSSGIRIVPWTKESQLKEDSLLFDFTKAFDGVFVELKERYSFEGYSKLKVSYVPGTCQNVRIYFDALLSPKEVLKLGNGSLKNGLEEVDLPLNHLIDSGISREGKLNASRLVLQGEKSKTTCKIESIRLE